MAREWQTDRLLARMPESTDLDGYNTLFLDPAVERWLRPEPLTPFDEAEIFAMLGADVAHWSQHDFGPWVLLERESGVLIGRGGLRLTKVDGADLVELPWAVRSDHWGRGLATEAAAAALDWARDVGLDEVVALIIPENQASQRVAERIGLQPSGTTMHAGLEHLVYRLKL